MTARALLAALDDEALAVLASCGLLRRAAKDLEAGLVTALADLPEGGLRAEVDGMTVTVPAAGPGAARCGCQARGPCRHLLAAALACRGTAEAPPPDPRAELAALDLAALRAILGRATLRAARELLEEMPPVTIDEEPGTILIHWPGETHPLRFIAGGGFAGMISRIPPARREVVHAAAVLAWRRAAGLPSGEEAEPEAPAPAGLDAEERAFLDQAEQVLHDILRLGLAAAAGISHERVAATAVSARAEHLPRLAAALRSLVAGLEGLAARRVEATAGEALARLARTAAVIEALRRAPPERLAGLRGRTRPVSAAAGTLILEPLIGHRWRTRGGSEGVRLLFWAPERGDWLDWSQPRLERAGLDPAAGFADLGPWPPLRFAALAGRSRLSLGNAVLGNGRRLSASAATLPQILPDPAPAADQRFGIADFADWAAVTAWMARRLPVGLSGEDNASALAVLRPAAWGRRRFDNGLQALLCPLLDPSGAVLTLRIPYHPVTATRIAVLERLPDRLLSGAAVLCELSASSAGLWLEPLGLIRADDPRVIHLDFPPADLAAPADAAPPIMMAPPTPPPPPPPPHPILALAIDIAEAGLGGGLTDRQRHRAAQLAGEAQAQGLRRPAALLARLAADETRPAILLALVWQIQLLERLALRRG